MKVILSTALMLEDGTYSRKTISMDEAIEWVSAHKPENFCGHATVKLLGLEPAPRKSCKGYSQALCIRPKTRLEFGKDYSLAELQELGVELECVVITYHG